MRNTMKLRQPGPGGRTNEIGAAMCRDLATGKISFGPFSEGTPTSVSIDPTCPPGTKLFAIYHTHPGGVALPSQTDLKSGRRIGAEALCINADGDLRCHNLK